ncbi:GNAT family N-acetyltransferase [Paenarthrobacter sp. Z7-10]|uniref:GNAT family N-acetyltransferase n=1 Tax=Paenarthrobacter sp. Z7-10 TaxID=2787635 RepID=UPI0022A9BB5F|nr:GNAT family protein [Paenarthrobacter sp. Z7-10]
MGGFAVEAVDAPGFLGEIALKWGAGTAEGPKTGEIGWTLTPGGRGQGYATEAASAVLELTFEFLNIHRIEARLDDRNTASAAICERLGMRREARLLENWYLKGEWSSDLVYATLATEWRQHRS